MTIRLYSVKNRAGLKGYDFEIASTFYGFIFFGRHKRAMRLSRGKQNKRNIIFNFPLVHGLITRDGANVLTHVGAQ